MLLWQQRKTGVRFIVGSQLCKNVEWCRYVMMVICCPVLPFLCLLNCLHGYNPDDGSGHYDVMCCCEHVCNKRNKSYDELSDGEGSNESTPMLLPPDQSWHHNY